MRRWLNRPVDYSWTVSYYESHTGLVLTRILIGVSCWIYCVLYTVAATMEPTAPSGPIRVLIAVVTVLTFGVGVAWIRGPWPSRTMSLAFVVFADVGLATVLFSLEDPLAALPLTLLFTVATYYLVTFHTPRVFLCHHGFSIVISCALFVQAVGSEAGRTTLAPTYGLLIVMVSFLTPVSVYRLKVVEVADMKAAFFDPLTGLRNRRGMTLAALEYASGPVEISAVVVDIDRFKAVNDEFGHHHGDQIIRLVAGAISEAFPAPSITARTGGEEFAVYSALPREVVLERAESLRRDFAVRAGRGISVSIGVSERCRVADSDDVERLLVRADRAMYRAKSAGGDAIVVDSDEVSREA